MGGNDIISDFIFCKGKLYALKKDWSLAVMDPRFLIAFTNVRMEKYLFHPTVTVTVKSYFLVESCGEILMVTISFWRRDMARIHVFRADMIEMKWVKVKNLGDRTRTWRNSSLPEFLQQTLVREDDLSQFQRCLSPLPVAENIGAETFVSVSPEEEE
ncbi:hypothetical protein MRB53_015616 [Persea americana]|uniref:Uncharacterized protein n=1 Tax=Persea americana TaxID=3435 RepID=A0ACC2LZM1_PERAE|nr:hypothetical protein MRB53_015616 [Persea americana]